MLCLLVTGCGGIHSSDPTTRKEALNKLNQTDLAEIALRDRLSYVRMDAVAKLDDQPLLARIAIQDTNQSVRVRAVGSLKDQSILAKVVMESTNSSVRLFAVAKLSDQTLLGKIALEDKDEKIRRTAFLHITNPAVLSRLSTEAPDKTIRLAANVWRSVLAARPSERELRYKGKLGEIIQQVVQDSLSIDDFMKINLLLHLRGQKEGGRIILGIYQTASDQVYELCTALIRKGDTSRVPELVKILRGKELATLYLNCGQSTLASAARSWALANGYKEVPVGGSGGARWGQK